MPTAKPVAKRICTNIHTYPKTMRNTEIHAFTCIKDYSNVFMRISTGYHLFFSSITLKSLIMILLKKTNTHLDYVFEEKENCRIKDILALICHHQIFSLRNVNRILQYTHTDLNCQFDCCPFVFGFFLFSSTTSIISCELFIVIFFEGKDWNKGQTNRINNKHITFIYTYLIKFFSSISNLFS